MNVNPTPLNESFVNTEGLDTDQLEDVEIIAASESGDDKVGHKEQEPKASFFLRFLPFLTYNYG